MSSLDDEMNAIVRYTAWINEGRHVKARFCGIAYSAWSAHRRIFGAVHFAGAP